MEVREMQVVVDRWIGQFQEGYWHPLVQVARLAEEVGELAREINHRFGQKTKRSDEPDADLALEIADVLFILITLANSQGIDLESAFRDAMRKYQQRDAHRWTPRGQAQQEPPQRA